MTEFRWKSSPSFLMRRYCIIDTIKNWPRGRFLECGAGTGTMTTLFLENGYHGTVYDIAQENREILRKNLSRYSKSFQVISDLQPQEPGSFDYLFAFEVLEHVEKDLEALQNWTKFLAPGGRLLISVPARMKKFRDDDRYMGHWRRYEKLSLREMLDACGFGEIRIRSYGVPIINLTRLGSVYLHAKEMERNAAIFSLSRQQRSICSGVERLDTINRMSFIFNPVTLWPFKLIQRVFYALDLGEGYIVSAVKMSDSVMSSPSSGTHK